MATRIVSNNRQVIRTTDATQATLATYGPTNNGVLYATAIVLAISTGGAMKVFELKFPARTVSNVTQLVGSIVSVATQGDIAAATWQATLDVSGGFVRVRITGQAATTIDWSVDLNVHEYAP